MERGRRLRVEAGRPHALNFGLTYSRRSTPGAIRRRWPRSPTAAATSARSTRSTLGRFAAAHLDYGSRYARYDYLQRGDLLSPRAAVAIEPLRHTRS